MAKYEVYSLFENATVFSSENSDNVVALEEFVEYMISLGADFEDPHNYRVTVDGKQVDLWDDPKAWDLIAHPFRLDRSALAAERMATMTRFDLLSLIACAEDYGHNNDVLMTILFRTLGKVTDAEIELYALTRLSPDGRAQGYAFEDYAQTFTRIRDMRIEHGEDAETGTDG